MSELETVSNYVPAEYIIWTIVVVFALIIIVIKYAPKAWKHFNTARKKTNEIEDLVKAVKKNTEDIELINQKIGRDYARLNQIQQMTTRQQKYIEESIEERELILRVLLGVVQGLQEVGANGPTKKAEAEIQAYLLRKSHETPSE